MAALDYVLKVVWTLKYPVCFLISVSENSL